MLMHCVMSCFLKSIGTLQ